VLRPVWVFSAVSFTLGFVGGIVIHPAFWILIAPLIVTALVSLVYTVKYGDIDTWRITKANTIRALEARKPINRDILDWLKQSETTETQNS